MNSYISFCAALVAAFLTRQLSAQDPLHNFDDNTSGDFAVFEDFAEGSSFGPTQSSIVDGRLVIGSNGPAPGFDADPSSFFRMTWMPSLEGTEFSNGFLRTTVSPLQNVGNAGMVVRAGVAPNEVDYEFWRDAGTGTFWFGRWDANADPQFVFLAGTEDNAVPYEVGEEWVMEAGFVGSDLSLKYWKAGETEPSAPQLQMTDTWISPFDLNASRMELAVFHESSDAVLLQAAFDDIAFTRVVPEPSPLALVCIGVMLAIGNRRRRTTNHLSFGLACSFEIEP